MIESVGKRLLLRPTVSLFEESPLSVIVGLMANSLTAGRFRRKREEAKKEVREDMIGREGVSAGKPTFII